MIDLIKRRRKFEEAKYYWDYLHLLLFSLAHAPIKAGLETNLLFLYYLAGNLSPLRPRSQVKAELTPPR